MEKPRQKSLPLIIEQIRSAYYHNDSNIDELLDELKDTMPESDQPKNLKFEKLLKNFKEENFEKKNVNNIFLLLSAV